MTAGARTGREMLAAIATPTDRLGVVDSRLAIDGADAADLLRRFGSPLYVAVEDTIRANYRRIAAAFGRAWPGRVTVMYAVKTNNTLAIRAILSSEGAGGDCFGLGELHACLAGGADPRRMVMNGSNKTVEEIAAAIARDIIINVDSEEEIPQIEAAALPGRRARVNLRLKPLPAALDTFGAEFFKSADGVRAAVLRSKWGYTVERAGDLVRRLAASPHVELLGYSCHIGRFSPSRDAFAVVAGGLGDDIARLFRETGYWPGMIDLGGGWPRQREPESRDAALNPEPIEGYADAACAALLTALALADRPVPHLWIEPGRYLVGNGVVLLATVGAIKRDTGFVWLHVDASTNNLMRIDTSRAWHHILPASRMDDVLAETVDIVGGTCIPSILGSDRRMPVLAAGDVLAVLDAGMYAEAISNQFNGIPRPATVLVSARGVDVIKRRETVEDLFATHAIPPHLAPGG